MLVLYIVLGVIVVALIVLTVIFFQKRKKEKAAAAAGGEVVAPGGDDISVLIHEAESKLSNAKLGAAAKVGNLPVFLIMGDPGTTKTSVVLHSGLEPELLSGQVYQAGNVTPTRTANFWFSRKAIFAEAGGPMTTDTAKWGRLVKRLTPKASVVGKGEQAPRGVIVCFDCENFTKPGAADIAANAARTLRARLGEMSQAFGINLPVYALFTKSDRLPFFTDFVRNLTNDESTQVLGMTLPMVDRSAEGVYAEQETARLTGNFERLFRSLADARIEFLARETDATKLPPSYEFPREFRKIRPSLVQFLVDLCRPSQLTVGPFLRGFYFTGVRPIIVNEAAPVAAALPQAASGMAGATGIFSYAAQPAAAPAAPVIGTRKVPQWLFLAHLFNDVLLVDRSAMGASGASLKTSTGRRWLYGVAAALCFLLCVCFTISFFNNRALETRVRDAAAGISSVPTTGSDVASLDVLRRLETLRQSLETLVRYRHDGSPLFYRFFLYEGDALYPEARRIYFDRFKAAMFGQTQNALLQNCRSLPASPVADHEYQPTYDSLKAYLITTSYHDKSTKLFLTPTLMTWWTAGRTVDPDRRDLAVKQFDFYADELKEDNPYSKENDTLAVERARAYLKQFAGTERVYAFMLGEADKAGKPVNFNRDFPGSAEFVLNSRDVRGAFTKGGYKFMNDAIAHADRYFNGEPWVLGDQGAATIDRAKLEQDLKSRYHDDFVKAWTDYMKTAQVTRYGSLKDAARKLKTHSSPLAPLLEMSSQASQNTAVDDPNLKNTFQPVQSVTPPENTDKYVAPPNQNYIQALQQLQATIEGIADQPPNDTAAASAMQVAKQAELTVGQMANSFRIDSPIMQVTQALLLAPITNAELLLKPNPGVLNAGGKDMCRQIDPILAKYPFKPNAQAEASIGEFDSIFKPKEGAIWKFYEQVLQPKYLTRQGSHFVAVTGAPFTITSAFLNFLNHAGDFTDAAYPGGVGPQLKYQVRPELGPDMESLVLTLDGQTVTYNAGAAAKQFTWPGSTQGSTMKVIYQGNQPFEWPPYPGPWSVFRFVASTKRSGSFYLKDAIDPSGGAIRHNGVPVEVKLEFLANPNIFQPGYFSFTCEPNVAR